MSLKTYAALALVMASYVPASNAFAQEWMSRQDRDEMIREGRDHERRQDMRDAQFAEHQRNLEQRLEDARRRGDYRMVRYYEQMRRADQDHIARQQMRDRQFDRHMDNVAHW